MFLGIIQYLRYARKGTSNLKKIKLEFCNILFYEAPYIMS